MSVDREIGFGYGSSNTQINFKSTIDNPLGNKQILISSKDCYKGIQLGMTLFLDEEDIRHLIAFLQNEVEN